MASENRSFLLQSINGVFVDGERLQPEGEHVLPEPECWLSVGPRFKWRVRVKKKRPKESQEVKVESRLALEALGAEEVRLGAIHVYPEGEREVRVVPAVVDGLVKWFPCHEPAGNEAKPVQGGEDTDEPAAKRARTEDRENNLPLVSQLRSKFNEELSCTICNEIFIRPMSMPW